MLSGSVGNVETTRVGMIRPTNQNINILNKTETFNSVVTQQLKQRYTELRTLGRYKTEPN